MASSFSLHPLLNLPLHKPNSKTHRLGLNPPSLPFLNRPHRPLKLFFHCNGGSTNTTSLERLEGSKHKEEGGLGEKALIRIRVEHQVDFRQSVGIVGSTEELGSWREEVGMEWTKDGWVCEIELPIGGELVEYKFIELSNGGRDRVWENGVNRVLEIPKRGGVYEMVCKWDKTDEGAELVGSGEGRREVVVVEDGGGEVVFEGEGSCSSFVEQWQGREVSFMRSNEHGGRESERKWDTSGLEGVALRVVEGDQIAKNWWRKVIFIKKIPRQ